MLTALLAVGNGQKKKENKKRKKKLSVSEISTAKTTKGPWCPAALWNSSEFRLFMQLTES